jgi:hypothetical protein
MSAASPFDFADDSSPDPTPSPRHHRRPAPPPRRNLALVLVGVVLVLLVGVIAYDRLSDRYDRHRLRELDERCRVLYDQYRDREWDAANAERERIYARHPEWRRGR